ncbi:MAG: sensor histidine kinase [bacterium]
MNGDLRAARSGQSIRLAALRVPLAVKLIGANLIVVAIVSAVWIATGGRVTGVVPVIVLGAALLHLGLVTLALRPLREIDAVVSRVRGGDFGARVQRSTVADHEVLRVGAMFNLLLDSLESDRERMRALAAEVIAVGDRERAALARELHDSIAQQVAALLLQLSTAARDADDIGLADRLTAARDSAEAVLEEVRVLSHTVHPRVLDDLGLEVALRRLARDSSTGNGIDIDVNAQPVKDRLPARAEAVLYRVAQEAVRNATQHGAPTRVSINVVREMTSATLEVHDDGHGFDLAEAERESSHMGLLSMRERLALVNGSLDIKTAKGSGTTISATVPLDAPTGHVHSEHA